MDESSKPAKMRLWRALKEISPVSRNTDDLHSDSVSATRFINVVTAKRNSKSWGFSQASAVRSSPGTRGGSAFWSPWNCTRPSDRDTGQVKQCSVHRVDSVKKATAGSVKVHPQFQFPPGTRNITAVAWSTITLFNPTDETVQNIKVGMTQWHIMVPLPPGQSL